MAGPPTHIFAGKKPKYGTLLASYTDNDGYTIEIRSGAPTYWDWKSFPLTYQRHGTKYIINPNGDRVLTGYWMNSPERHWKITQKQWNSLSWKQRAEREALAQATEYKPLKEQFKRYKEWQS